MKVTNLNETLSKEELAKLWDWEFWGDRFSSKEDAQQRIDELTMEDKSRKIKLLECDEV